MSRDLSIVIPARNEEFLQITIESILKTFKSDFEIIAILDGYWPDPPIQDHPRVTLIHHSQSIGQRAATNEGVRLSTAKYILKSDAHCTFDEGFDAKMIAPYEAFEIEKDVTSVARMYNLHAFNWKCLACGEITYQGPPPEKCAKCDTPGGDRVEGANPPRTANYERQMVWAPRLTRKTDFARFDNTLHFQYWGSYGKRPHTDTDIADLMCCVGACWMMPRERYFEIDGMDERHGSWGQMGVELACKSWLSGGRQIVNKRTWFSHLFRTQPGFGFPYPNPGIEKARVHSRHLWFDGKWEKAKLPLSWLIEKFAPVPDWDDYLKTKTVSIPPAGPVGPEIVQPAESSSKGPPISILQNATKGICFYTENRCPPHIFKAVQENLLKSSNGMPIVSVSLKPIDFGKNIVLPLERGILTMFKQILAGLEALDTEFAFLCEHDMLYHKSHFDFTPNKPNIYFYNTFTYKIDANSGQALHYLCKQTSGLCANRKLLVNHYRRRIYLVETAGRFSRNMGFEPGTHKPPRGVDDFKAENWMSEFPNIDIRHGGNLTPSRWTQAEFRNKNSCLGWTMSDSVPGWGVTKGRFLEFLAENR